MNTHAKNEMEMNKNKEILIRENKCLSLELSETSDTLTTHVEQVRGTVINNILSFNKSIDFLTIL